MPIIINHLCKYIFNQIKKTKSGPRLQESVALKRLTVGLHAEVSHLNKTALVEINSLEMWPSILRVQEAAQLQVQWFH